VQCVGDKLSSRSRYRQYQQQQLRVGLQHSIFVITIQDVLAIAGRRVLRPVRLGAEGRFNDGAENARLKNDGLEILIMSDV